MIDPDGSESRPFKIPYRVAAFMTVRSFGVRRST